jgi:DNA invertase Pin-like site-specific DNA recombinase
VSTRGQNLDSQLDALLKAGCARVFAEKQSGVKEKRQEWDKLLDYTRPGDVLVITELSRMTRSLKHLLTVIGDLEERGVKLVSLRENIDTSTATGRAFVSIMGAINQMELELRAERVEAGREAAKARGGTGGRPKADMDLISKAITLYENSDRSVDDICKTFQVPKRTFYKYLAEKRGGEDALVMRRGIKKILTEV